MAAASGPLTRESQERGIVMRYDVTTDIYEGPLPLLVELTKFHLIDIFLIQLQGLTQQYRERVTAAGLPVAPGQASSRAAQADVDLNSLAEPLPLLGTLLAIKARSLLPQPGATEDNEEVPVSLEELERRLKEYEQFKTVAQLLSELHVLQHQHFGKKPSDAPAGEAGVAQAPFDVELTDLMSAFAKVLERSTAVVYEITAEPWTVEMKVEELRLLIMTRKQVSFLELFTAKKSRLELVVTFLALLELMRQRIIRAMQEQPFSDILLMTGEALTGSPGQGSDGPNTADTD